MNEMQADDLVNAGLPGSDASGEGRHEGSLRRAAYLTAALGIAHALLYLLSYFMLQQTPKPTASDAEIVEFYTSGGHRQLILIGLYVMPFAGIAFLWFIVALRMWISRTANTIDVMLSNVQLVCGIIFTALLFTAGAASATTAASMEFASGPVDPMLARQLPLLSSTMLIVFAMRMAAMFVFTTSSIGRSTGILPRWFVVLGFAVGLFLLLSATLSVVLALVFPVWVLILCAVLIRRARGIPAGATIPSRRTNSSSRWGGV